MEVFFDGYKDVGFKGDVFDVLENVLLKYILFENLLGLIEEILNMNYNLKEKVYMGYCLEEEVNL